MDIFTPAADAALSKHESEYTKPSGPGPVVHSSCGEELRYMSSQAPWGWRGAILDHINKCKVVRP